MPAKHDRDLSIGTYAIIGLTFLGSELAGVSAAFLANLLLAGIVLVLSLAAAILALIWTPPAMRRSRWTAHFSKCSRPTHSGGAPVLAVR
jgi:hypothetical protein